MEAAHLWCSRPLTVALLGDWAAGTPNAACHSTCKKCDACILFLTAFVLCELSCSALLHGMTCSSDARPQVRCSQCCRNFEPALTALSVVGCSRPLTVALLGDWAAGTPNAACHSTCKKCDACILFLTAFVLCELSMRVHLSRSLFPHHRFGLLYQNGSSRIQES